MWLALKSALVGTVAVDQLTFRYKPDRPSSLYDVSLTIHTGEFVVLVWASDPGNSTHLCLLLSFERPTAGTNRYDERDLAMLDVREVRQ